MSRSVESLPTASSAAARRVYRVRHEVRRRPVSVLRTETVGCSCQRIVFGGEALEGFRSEGFDDHVKFVFTNAGGESLGRDYTPRHFDAEARELTIEFLLHGGGEASTWAASAVRGSEATIGGPKSSMVIPSDYHWHLLVGDDAALPAMSRRLEELPATTRAIVIVRAAPEDVARLPRSAARVDVTTIDPGGDLVGALKTLSWPEGDGFVWCAGEAGVMATMRDWLLAERRHPLAALRVAAYWKRAEPGFHKTLQSGLPDAEG